MSRKSAAVGTGAIALRPEVDMAERSHENLVNLPNGTSTRNGRLFQTNAIDISRIARELVSVHLCRVYARQRLVSPRPWSNLYRRCFSSLPGPSDGLHGHPAETLASYIRPSPSCIALF